MLYAHLKRVVNLDDSGDSLWNVIRERGSTMLETVLVVLVILLIIGVIR